MGSKVLSYHDSDSVGDSSKLFDQNFSSIRDSVSALTCKEKKNFKSQDDSLALVLIMLYFKLFIW